MAVAVISVPAATVLAACLLITGCAVAVLLGADLYEFSWRYQLPALVTLPAAGAFGVTALVRFFQARRQDAVAAVAGGAPEVFGAVEAAGATFGPSGPGRPTGADEPAEAADELAIAGSEQVAP